MSRSPGRAYRGASFAVAAILVAAWSIAVVLLPTRAVSTDIVISQVYGGGGNAGAPYKNDFIELHNRSSASVSLAGWTVQYAATAGSWQRSSTPLSGSIPAGGYYLVQEAAGAGGRAAAARPRTRPAPSRWPPGRARSHW